MNGNLKMNNNFYIYIYLDPRKSGLFEYGEYEFEYEPFYVGKGKGNRCDVISDRTEYFKRIINKMKKSGLEPIIIKLKENLNEKQSFILESKLIKLIGRKDLNKGSLINFTDGGEGNSGWVPSEETRKKISEKNKGENHYLFGKHPSEETRKLMSEKQKGKKRPELSKRMKGENNPNYGKGLFGKNNPMYRKHPSKETRRKQSEKRKEKYLSENHYLFGKHPSDETRKKISKKLKEKFKSGELINLKGENHPNSILKEKDVIEIWKDLNEGILTQKEISEKFGVSRLTISAIKNNKIWKHI